MDPLEPSKRKIAWEITQHEGQKLKARELYLRYRTPKQIAKELDIPEMKVNNWIYGSRDSSENWKRERDELAKEVISETLDRYSVRRKQYLPQILETSLALVLNAVQTRAKDMDASPVTLKEAEVISNLITNLDKLNRLDAGEATDIIQEKKATITIEDLKKAVEKDYFLEVTPTGETKLVKPKTVEIETETVDPFREAPS